MYSLLGATSSPISRVKAASAATASSISTRSMVRVAGARVHLPKPLVSLYRIVGYGAELFKKTLKLALGVGVVDLLVLGYLVKGRLGDVDISVFYRRPHKAEEEGKQQTSDVASVDVGIGHDDYLVVAEL